MAKWIEDPQGRLEVEKVTEEIKLPVWKANYKGKFREFWNECWDKIENSFLKLKKSIDGKEAVITKKSGFNLEKTDSFEEDDTNKLATAKALKSLHDEVDRKTGAIKLNWDSIKDKPSSFVPSEHNHNSLYYTETEVDEKLENNILYSTGKTYGGLLNESGVKSAGKAYWDNNTKKLYICKNDNSDISRNINNYIPFDSNSLLERLENLYKIEYKTDYDVLTILNRKIVIGSLETKGATASKTLIANGFSFKNSIVMATAKKDNCSVAVIHSGDNLDFSTLDATSGNVQNGICKVDFFILLRN